MFNLPIEKCEIKFKAEPEHCVIRDHFDSGEPELDLKTEQDILDRLNDGDGYAWFCARVSVSYGEITEHTYLGGCSYKDEKDFVENSGYYDDMVEEARIDLELRLLELYNNLKSLDKD
jgi:hypothetical protein